MTPKRTTKRAIEHTLQTVRETSLYRYGGTRKYTKSFGVASIIGINDELIDKMAWHRKRQDLPAFSEFDSQKEYSAKELEDFTEALLREDAKSRLPIGEYPAILFAEHLYSRQRREILCEQGYPDESITQALSKDGQTMFFRTHPAGRKVNSQEQRSRNGAGYYR